MGRKRSSTKLPVGTRVRVKEGTAIPECPDVQCGGWTGVIDDLIGKSKPDPGYVVEWDEPTLANMPAGYVARCEESGLYFRMACLTRGDLEVICDES